MIQTTDFYRRRTRKISLTALIDVVFILLMFFMLTSTFSQWNAVDFQSPVSSTEPVESAPKILILAADGSLRTVNGGLVIETDQKLTAGDFASDAPVVLMPEASTRVQMVVSRIEEFKRMGLTVTMGGITDADAGN